MFLHWSLLGHLCPLKLHFIANLTIALHNSLQNYLSTLVLGIVDVITTQEKSPNKAVDDFLRCDFLKINSEWETGDLPDFMSCLEDWCSKPLDFKEPYVLYDHLGLHRSMNTVYEPS